MATLKQIVRQEVHKYASSGEGVNLRLFPILDDDHQHYTVIAVNHPIRQHEPGIVVMVRIFDDKVIIEEDNTNKQLVAALMQRGVPREQIILAYTGESADAYSSQIPLPEYDYSVLES
jgi:hypothetical protein